jgi:arylsulfatase A-like enzyme|eukprot:COSAG01_NODE_597_length_15020_cov_195.298170_6_plen_522_part_00
MAHRCGGAGPINVLLVTCDQWRADCLSCAKHPVVRTPNLDRLAADGVRFTNHFCQCVPCGPSRASLYCGMYQMNTRVISNRAPLAARHTNIANELRAAGYDPVLSGYTSTVTEQPARREGEAGLLPGMRSLNSDSGGTPEHLASSWARWLDELGYDVPAGMRFASPEITGAVLGDDPNLSDLVSRGAFTHARDARGVPVAAFYKPEHGDTAFAVNQVLSHIKHQSESSEPWACHLSLFKPHPPWLAAAPFNARYLPAEAGLPDHRRATISEEACLHPWLGQRLARGGYVAPEADDDLQLLRSQYFALCEETDSQLGRLFDELRADGSYDNTVIVMTSDHGEQLGDHWLLNKDGFFDQSYHVPLIIRCPSVVSSDTTTTHTARRGAVISAFTEHVDIMPTILECLLRRRGWSMAGTAHHSQSMSTSCPPSWNVSAYRYLPRPTAARYYQFCTKDAHQCQMAGVVPLIGSLTIASGAHQRGHTLLSAHCVCCGASAGNMCSLQTIACRHCCLICRLTLERCAT